MAFMQYGSLFNGLMANSKQPAPEVGMGATMLMWSDRHAATILEVTDNGKSLTVQRDKAIRTDEHGMSDSQSYRYESDPEGAVHTFTLRKNGRWVRKGEPIRDGMGLIVGHRQEYYDFSF